MKTVLFLFLLISISSCSIYKSEGRKSFESKSPTLVNANIGVQKCENVSELGLELDANFTNEPRELLTSKDGYEVWKSTLADGQVQITEIVTLETDYSVCKSNFSSEDQWQKSKSDFLVNNSSQDN